MMDKFNPSDANHITRNYLDSILIEERLMDSDIASTEFELFGEKFASPIMTPSFSHLETFGPGRQNGMCEYSLGAKMAGVVNWVGMGENEDFAEIMKAGAKTIKVIKPMLTEISSTTRWPSPKKPVPSALVWISTIPSAVRAVMMWSEAKR